MPAKRSTRQQAPAKKEAAAETTRSRSKRGASPTVKAGAKRKASPSPAPAKTPKKGRKESESPAPTKRQSARGASAASKKEETKTAATTSGRSASKGNQSKGRVTRNVVEKAETKKAASPRGRSSSQKVTAQKKETPKRSATPKKAAASPKKKQTPKQKSPARGRSTTPKSKKTPSTPKQKVTPKQKSTPKVTTKRSVTPKQKPVTPKAKSSPKKKTPAKSPVVTKSPTKSPRSKTPVKKDVEMSETKSPKDEASPQSDEKLKESRVEISKETKAKADEAVEANNAADTEQEMTDETNASTENEPAEDEKAEPVEDEKAEVEDISQEEDKPEESPEAVQDEAVQDEASAAEDENVEEDQEAPEENEEKEEDSVEALAAEDKIENDDLDDQIVEQSNQVEKEEDAIEQQAESEQIESDSKEECESAESDQVEADVSAPESAEATNEAVENTESLQTNESEAIEVNSDVSSKEDDKVIEINEDSGEAMIIEEEIGEEDIREETATVNAGAGDSKWAEQSDKPETEIQEDDIQEVGVTPAPVIEVQDEEEAVNDVSSTGIEEAEDAIQVIEPESVENSKVSNGATTDESPPRKRKLEDMDDLSDEIVAKKVKTVEESRIENGSLSHESDVTADYVVVNMNEIPAADSDEIKDSLPVVPAPQQQSSSVDQNPVFSRVFIPNPGYTTSGDATKQFSVVSYNILADCHLFRNDYSFTEAKYLAPEYRLTNLMKELEYLNGDVVCLQEVDPDFFNDTLLPKMQSLGYEGIHKKRTTEYFKEGEATFYKLNRFSLVDYSTPRLADLVEKELVDGIEPSVRDAVRKYLDLSDVLIVTKLKCNKTGAEVTIGNIHVVWGGMEIPDAQCVQIASAIKEVVSKAGVDNLPHLICGDFNSPPNSPGYLVARDGYPTGDETVTKLQEINSLQLPNDQTSSLVNSLWPAFQHTSSLRSAYNEVEGSEPKISSYNKVMKDTVDYVFYSHSCLDNVGVLRTADKASITGTGGIPDQHFPSDHVSLKAVLAFK